MADFYNAPEVQGADFTKYSKGFKGDTTLASTIKGASDVLGMGVQAADDYYTNTIKEESRTQTERLLGDYGNDAAVDAVGGIDSNVTPKQIQQGVNRLSLLNQAQKNGTLKESSFWAQAEMISRQLKMRYPGYWEQIDTAMSRQLGRKPALALQSELQSEREATASASDKERSNALKAARSAGLTEVFVAESQGKPMSTIEINTRVANRNNIEWQQQSTQRKFALKKARGEATEEDAISALRVEANNTLSVMVNDGTSPFFSNLEEFDQQMNALQRQRASGKGVDPDIQAQVASLKDQLVENVKLRKAQLIQKYSSDLSSDKLKETLGFMDEWVEMYTSLVDKGDSEVARNNTALLKAMQDSDAFQFLTSNDALRKKSAMVRVAGEQALNNWEARNAGSKVIATHDLAIESAMEDDVLLGHRSLGDASKKLQEQQIKDPNTFNKLLRKTLDATTADELPEEIRDNATEAIFGEKNRNFLADDVSNSERLPVYLRLGNLSVLKNARKLYDAGKMKPETYQKINDRIRIWGTQLLKDEASDINEIVSARKSKYIKYDDKTNLLYTAPIGSYEPVGKTLIGKGITAYAESYAARRGVEATQRANSIIKIIKQQAELNGENVENVVKQLLNEAGIVVSEEPSTGEKETTIPEAIVPKGETAVDIIAGGIDPLANLTEEQKQEIEKRIQEPTILEGILDILGFKAVGTEDNPIIIDQPADTSSKGI